VGVVSARSWRDRTTRVPEDVRRLFFGSCNSSQAAAVSARPQGTWPGRPAGTATATEHGLSDRGARATGDRDSLTVYLRFPREHWTRVRHSNFVEHTFGETRPGEGHRPPTRRTLLPQAGLGGARPPLGRVARIDHDTGRAPAAARPAPVPAPTTDPTIPTPPRPPARHRRKLSGPSPNITPTSGARVRAFYTAPGRHRSMGVVLARRGPLVGTLRRCRSTRLLYFAAVQQRTIRHPGLLVRGWRGPGTGPGLTPDESVRSGAPAL
jgi:hypothetical protein